TFLALLELIRLRQVVARQSAAFGEIVIARPETAEQRTDGGRKTDDGRQRTDDG
ncbi:MAG: hypothetical protein HYV36_06550, partial [Lentisphaerae bacterium]|nr:hypothetical protein [Lentisphaerota bacterium]